MSLNVFGVQVRLLAEPDGTGERFSFAEAVVPSGAGAPLHRHEGVERFYVVAGRLCMELAGERREYGPGDYVEAGPSVAHRFSNEGAEDAKVLLLASPGGHAAFFREADALSRSGGFNPVAAEALCRRHGIELLSPVEA